MTDEQVVLRLVVAAVLGAIVGLERGRRGHAAGLRTHTLVALGSALIMITNLQIALAHSSEGMIDVTRMSAQVVSGIGFLGAGTIIRSGVTIKGLTTAATLWVVAALGLACGAGSWVAAATATVLVILGLAFLNRFGIKRTK